MKVAPSELKHAPFRALTKKGKGNGKIEREHGVDFLIEHEGAKVGVQRKEIKDLVASMNDKRLATEIQLMGELDIAVLVVEGNVRWSTEGALLAGGHSSLSRWTKTSHLSLMLTVQSKGIWLINTADVGDTAIFLQTLERWVQKGEHKSLDATRVGPKALLGSETKQHIAQRHVLSGFPHMGPERATVWINHFGGTGLVWEIGAEDMMEVPGIGATIAEDLIGVLEGE